MNVRIITFHSNSLMLLNIFISSLSLLHSLMLLSIFISILFLFHIIIKFIFLSGYKTLEVIEGRADAYVHTTRIKKWDICAGNAILSAFHGKMTTLEGAFIDYSSRNEVTNNDGLLATLYDHYKYLEQHVAKPMKHNKDQR